MSWSSLRRLRHLQHLHAHPAPQPERNPVRPQPPRPRPGDCRRNHPALRRLAVLALLTLAASTLHAGPLPQETTNTTNTAPHPTTRATRPLPDWQHKVSARDRDRVNPLADAPDAPAAGAHLFARNCASCHGADAQGHGSRPSLRSARVHDATDGQLFWLLTNGELGHGMPSWARLPEPQRWQLVRFLHTLPVDDTPAASAAPINTP